jgi:calcineurin-like phosphoesterase family protein
LQYTNSLLEFRSRDLGDVQKEGKSIKELQHRVDSVRWAFPEIMKLLITADLHFRLHWFRWLIDQAPEFDLVCIAGDLLDMFKSATRLEQAREIAVLVRELADRVPVAVCSGNHDNAGRLVSHDRASLYEWFIELGTHRNIITDGSTRKLENLIVTTVPYHCSRQEKSIWLDRGSKIRKQTGMPWIVRASDTRRAWSCLRPDPPRQSPTRPRRGCAPPAPSDPDQRLLPTQGHQPESIYWM